MAKWLAMASIIGQIKRNRKYGIPMERNFDGEKIRLQHRMYTSTHARMKSSKQVGSLASESTYYGEQEFKTPDPIPT